MTTTMTIGMLLSGLQFVTVDSRAWAADPTAEIEKLGGVVRETAVKSGEFSVEFHLSGTELTDAGLAHVAALKNVVSLNLANTNITDAGLTQVAGLTKLRRLHLEKTGVGDEGIAKLKSLADLEYLNLYRTKATDRSLTELAGLKKLRRLFLWQTEVTDAGVTALKKALPELQVMRGADLSYLANIKEIKREPPKPLKWLAVKGKLPKSKSGQDITVFFENHSKKTVKLIWIGYDGKRTQYAELRAGEKRQQNSYEDNTWLITDEKDQPLGHFIIGGSTALAVIPAGA